MGSQGVGQSHRWLAVVEKCESEEVVGVGSLIGQQTFEAEASWRSPAVPATTSPMVRRSFETARFSLQKQHTPWQSCVRFALAGSFLKPTKNWMQDVCGIISMTQGLILVRRHEQLFLGHVVVDTSWAAV